MFISKMLNLSLSAVLGIIFPAGSHTSPAKHYIWLRASEEDVLLRQDRRFFVVKDAFVLSQESIGLALP